MSSKDVTGCSNPQCGSPRKRCPLCNINFVSEEHTVCYECQDGINNLCDNCSQPQTKLFKTHLDEFWCFGCLQHYNEIGPALPVNKLIKETEFEKDLEEDHVPTLEIEDCREILERRKRIKRNGYSGAEKFFDNDLKRCLGCRFPIPIRDDPENNNFCNVCLTLIHHKVCVDCFEEWDPEVGCDEYGKCINCSNAVRYKNYAYGYDNQTHKAFDNYDGQCTNCGYEYAVPGSALCNNCLTRLIEKSKGRD